MNKYSPPMMFMSDDWPLLIPKQYKVSPLRPQHQGLVKLEQESDINKALESESIPENLTVLVDQW